MLRLMFAGTLITVTFLLSPARGHGQGNSAAPRPTPRPTSTSRVHPISGGVLNGKAISKPQPAYPPIAKARKLSGTVTVRVLIDEEGAVVSAKAVRGHRLLRKAAVDAARQATFAPTTLSGERVKVSGLLTYDFVYEE